jgi:MYXO-CTERM domain-containing protein
MRTLVVVLAALAPASGLAYSLAGPSWDTERGPIRYHLHPEGSADVSDGKDLEAVRSAFALWSCIEGSSVRFVEGEPVSARSDSPTDGLHTVFWDEDGSFGLGPATLAVTRSNAYVAGEPAVRDTFDMILNGTGNHTWVPERATEEGQVAIFNVVLREIGITLGLLPECVDEEDPATCRPADESILSPYIPRSPRGEIPADDVAGILALYATDDGSSCQGPYRQGEACTCNADCVGELTCGADTLGDNVCLPRCNSAEARCPSGFACVLSASSGDDVAQGLCMRLRHDGQRPLASTCESDRQCSEGLCAALTATGRTACRKSCAADGDCPESYACTQGHCTFAGDLKGTSCSLLGEAPFGCGCSSSSSGPGAGMFVLGLLALGWRRRRAVT